MEDPLAPKSIGQTPLGPDELEGLRPTDVATRADLDEIEQVSIARALLRLPPPSVEALLDDAYIRRLHEKMFGEVWTWAGRYRTREVNIGVDPSEVAMACRNLVEDTRLWVGQGDDADMLSARFHHRLVQIHPYPNGNGRLARVATDLLLRASERPVFSWGAMAGRPTESLRVTYLHALRRADASGDIEPLLAFCRS